MNIYFFKYNSHHRILSSNGYTKFQCLIYPFVYSASTKVSMSSSTSSLFLNGTLVEGSLISELECPPLDAYTSPMFMKKRSHSHLLCKIESMTDGCLCFFIPNFSFSLSSLTFLEGYSFLPYFLSRLCLFPIFTRINNNKNLTKNFLLVTLNNKKILKFRAS